MPPLRKKGRGGGGGKTEAPFPGELPGTSPSVSATMAKKEKERRATPTSHATIYSHGMDNLGVFVSRSFQKERGERKLLEASRTSLHLGSGNSLQRSFQRARKAEPSSSTDSTPRLAATGSSARRDEREKRLTSSSGQAGYRPPSAGRRGREEPPVCRTSCRDFGEEKILYRKSLRSNGSSGGGGGGGGGEIRRAVGRRDDKSMEYSSRYNTIYPGISSGAGGARKGSQSVDGGLLHPGALQRLDRGGAGNDASAADLNHVGGNNRQFAKASPISPILLKKSPRKSAEDGVANSGAVASRSPVVNHPVKSSCKCGAFRSSDNSPSLMGGMVDDRHRRKGQSPLPPPLASSDAERNGGRKAQEAAEASPQGTPPPPLHSVRGSHMGSRGSSGANGNSNSASHVLQGRLALLEGRVTQIATELKATKDLLDANNPACSKALLTDIQQKISGIEQAINYRLARDCGLVDDQLEPGHLKGTYAHAHAHAHAQGIERQAAAAEARSGSRSGGRGGKSSRSVAGEIVPYGHGMYGNSSRSVQHSKALAQTGGDATSPAYDGISVTDAHQLARIASFFSPSRQQQQQQRPPSRGERRPALFQCLQEEDFYGDEIGGSAPSSHVKPALDRDDFEERLYPHQKLMRTRPSVHQKLMENRAALHQKLVENSVLLRTKLAALEERDGVTCDDVLDADGAAEYFTALKRQPPPKHSRADPKPDRGGHERGRKSATPKGASSRGASRAWNKYSVPPPRGSHGFLDYNAAASHSPSPSPAADVIPRERRRNSREGRRSSGGGPRRSISRSPTDVHNDELVFLPQSDRRRRAPERKSVSTSSSEDDDVDDDDGCSPRCAILPGSGQIVMLEPKSASVSNPPPHANDPPAEPAAGDDAEPTSLSPHKKKSRLPADSDATAERVKTSPRPSASRGGATAAAAVAAERTAELLCDESISSEDLTEEVPKAPQPPGPDNEQECADDDDADDDDVERERLVPIGHKNATAGWFISEGDGILLAHDDGCCTFYDAANMEAKASFKAPPSVPPGTWRDCWLVRAAGPEGTSNKYIVAASVSGATGAAFCSWDFYDRKLTAFHSESSLQPSPSTFSFSGGSSSSPDRRTLPSKDKQKAGHFSWYGGSDNAQLLKGRTPSGPLSLDLASMSDSDNFDSPLWWYRPCSPLLATACNGLKTVALYDVRDGDVVMRWELMKRVASMEFCSPIQWRNRGKLVVLEDQNVSVWDVNSMTPKSLTNVSFNGKEIRAAYVQNSDADYGKSIRQRSNEQVSGDGIVCTQDAVNVLDFRVPAGIVLKIPTFGDNSHSVFANGDSVFAGVTAVDRAPTGSRSSRRNVHARVNEWSIKQGRPMSSYRLSETSGRQAQQSVAQVWGNSDMVMGVNRNGLFMFDSLQGAVPETDGGQLAREVLCTEGLVRPTFDRSGNRVLLISQDRPASWCHWP